MSIDYTEDDFGLSVIVPALPFGLGRGITRHAYHIFGLRTEGRPHVSIVGGRQSLMDRAVLLLQTAGLRCTRDGHQNLNVNIGLRRDLRDQPDYAVKVLATIIQILEDRLAPFGTSTSLPAMPAAVVRAPAAIPGTADGVDPTGECRYVLAKLVNDTVEYCGLDGGVSSEPVIFTNNRCPDAAEGSHWIKIMGNTVRTDDRLGWLVQLEMLDATMQYVCEDGLSINVADQNHEHSYRFYGAVHRALRQYIDGPSCSIARLVDIGG